MILFVVIFLGFNTAVYKTTDAQKPQSRNLTERIDLFNYEYRMKNSNCHYFGIYAFNLENWMSLDASKVRPWCETPMGTKNYLVGYLEHSNMLLVVVEDQFELLHCGNITHLISKLKEEHANSSVLHQGNTGLHAPVNRRRPTSTTTSTTTTTSSLDSDNLIDESTFELDDESMNGTNGTNSHFKRRRKGFGINRYRQRPKSCHNFYQDEATYLPCHHSAASQQAISANSLWLRLTSNLLISASLVTINPLFWFF